MWDGNKFRARADDGIHGRANVAFPTALRNHNGQQYEVEDLTWNGKNYRAVGKIRPINSVSNTQNINENINKENFTMNFSETIAALDKLYESVDPALEKEEVLEEAVEDEVVDEEIPADEEIEVEDEEAEAADTQLVLECSKCGALIIKPEAEAVASDETDLVNVEEACQYCEEAEGYKVIGTFIPSEETAEITEGIFNKDKAPQTIRAFKANDPTFATKVAKELQTKFGGEIKQVKIKTGLADIWVDTAKKAKAANKYITKQYPNDSFSYNEYDSITEGVDVEVLPEDDLEEGILDKVKDFFTK
jgi:hypothetical protein